MTTNPEVSSDRPLDRLPVWLLRHIVRPENRQMDGKFKKGWWNSNDWNARHTPSHYTHGSYSTYQPQARVVVTFSNLVQNAHLAMNDYRLWAEIRWPCRDSLSQLIMARCRWCHERFPLREHAQVAKTHKTRCNFTHNLRTVYETLLQMGQCVSCGRFTKESRWGVPLCGEDCRSRWMFATDHSETMSRAIIRCRLAHKIKENETVFHETTTD